MLLRGRLFSFKKKIYAMIKNKTAIVCVGWTNFWRGRLSFYMIFLLYSVCVMELPYFLLCNFFKK